MRRPLKLLPFYLSYAVGLLVPVVMGMLFYARTTELAVEYTETQIDYVVEEVGLSIESIYRDVQFVASQMSLDPVLIRHASTTYGSQRETLSALLEVDVGNAAVAIVAQNPFISGFYLALPANGTVLSHSGMYSIESLHRFQLEISDVSLEEFTNRLTGQTYSFHWTSSATGAAGTGIPGRDLVLLHTFRPLSEPRGVFIWFISRQAIERALSGVDMDAGGLLVLRDSRGSVIHTSYREGPRFKVGPGGARFEQMNELANRSEAGIRTVRSPNGFVSIDVYLSPDNIRERIDYIRTTTLAIVLGLIALNTGLVIVFSVRGARPIRAMMRALASTTDESASPRSNGLSYLRDSVDGLVTETRKLQSEVARQRPVINSLLMESLIGGIRMRDEELATVLADGRIELGSCHCCFVITLSPLAEREARDFYDEFVVKTHTVAAILEHHVDGYLYYLLQGADRIVYIHGAEVQDEAVYYSRLAEQLRSAYAELTAALSSDVYLGIGESVTRLSKVCFSYDQAVSALSRVTAEATEGFVEYAVLMQDSTSYYYPMDLEIRLLNAVRSGDAQGVGNVVRKLDQENFVNRSVRPAMVSLLMHELKGSAIRTLSAVKELDDEVQESMAEFVAREFPPAEWERFLDAFTRVCDEAMAVFRTANKSRYSGLREGDVARYLRENFQDPNLSLTSVAERFNVNDKYLSRFFKEQLRVNYHSYVESLRLNHARELLEESDLSLKRIAEQSGYASQMTFARAFRRKFGLSPSVVRQKE